MMTKKDFNKLRQEKIKKGQQNRRFWIQYTYSKYLKDEKEIKKINNMCEEYKSELRCEL